MSACARCDDAAAGPERLTLREGGDVAYEVASPANGAEPI